jgi:transforming growth factor-beta-induced protein
LYYLVNGNFPVSSWNNDQLLTTLNNSTVRLNIYNTPTGPIYTVNGVRLSSNFTATNGILHIIDRVIISPVWTTLEAILNDNRFTILKAAITRVGGLDMFGPLTNSRTIFAPHDGAFAGINITNYSQSDIMAILGNHLVGSTYFSASFFSNMELHTVTGRALTITNKNNQLQVEAANIIQTDNTCTDGVVHVIDKVLLPPLPTRSNQPPPETTTSTSFACHLKAWLYLSFIMALLLF